ncbi:E3 ubiquitin-protein ligase HAKAI homolog isoform X2 [Tripterygium wilfordii]|uniref:E3 ubiquitin-protein ligase HAKAI homolog isoform X2 n=1 Tax=Tripterygium wilfordii TaxID=458696 RepID=UPI0018F8234A|nr:E3 ubiquitin-protein ligase HAKAI homolog isoform X2 [Tripterygium wilfordii]XP_038702107.1 E3 ubiquitin-protein ligase HAKAI homolog isoform X2 [Tripterygium wilfordii]
MPSVSIVQGATQFAISRGRPHLNWCYSKGEPVSKICDERIQKIQTIKMMEGIVICAAPHCLKSFLKRTEFESHIQESHANLLQPNADKEDGNESEAQSAKQQTPSESLARGPARSVISPASNSQIHDREDKSRRQQPREQMPPRPLMPSQQPFPGQVQNFPSEAHLDSNRPPGFDLPGPHNPFQQSFETQGTPQQESGQFSDKQQGILSETLYPGYPSMHAIQPPNFGIPMNSNPLLSTPFGVPPFMAEGGQPFYGTPYDMGHIARPDTAAERGSEPGSLVGFPPGAAGGVNFSANYSQPWAAVPAVMPFESVPGSQGMADGFTNMSDAQRKFAFYQGDYGRNPGSLPMVPPPPPVNRPMEAMQAGNSMDPRDGKGILAPQPLPHQARAPPPLPHLSQHKNKYHSGDMDREGPGFDWQHENRES